MIGPAFVHASRDHLIGEYVPKIRSCLLRLDDEAIWWRPGAASNAIGNLVLHLCGNACQWILHGILGRPDVRDRDSEFATQEGWSRDRLIEHLEAQMALVAEGLDELARQVERDPDVLLTSRTIQGMDVTVLQALYHVVEHYAQHTGQIIWATKQATDEDLRFWDVQDGVARPTW